MLNNLPADIKKFSYKQADYLSWVNELAVAIGCPAKDNTVVLLPEVGQGYSSAFFLEEGCTACVNNFKLNKEYLFTRQSSDNFGVIIYLYHFQTMAPVQYKLDGHSTYLDMGSHFELRITNSQTEQHLIFGKTTYVKGISIFLENGWIAKNLSHQIMEVFNYLQKVNYFKQFVNAKQQRLMNEIMNVPANHPYPDVFIRSRILRILDKLLETFLQRDISESPEKINEDDFGTLQKIEVILTKSYDQAFPGIEKLSRLSLMSESKLKKLFKQFFGMGLYEYYQKNRMHMAKELILSRKYSISEVGTKLGYQNLSNFSTAFRKEFNTLPSELNITN
jgi:AraC-like DNA-binding protein